MKEIATLSKYITEHCEASMEKAISSERYPLWKQSCNAIDDVSFTCHGIHRCISTAHSGRRYLQITDEIQGDGVFHSSYFNASRSSRRMAMVKALEK